MNSQETSTIVTIEHVTLYSSKSFEEVKSSLENTVPSLDLSYADLIADGKVIEARALLEQQGELSIFGSRDHGGVLLTAGFTGKAIQYDIGNPITASEMTRHDISAALYAPIRVLLREDKRGRVAFEYDRPLSTFGQFNNSDVDAVASPLDDLLKSKLMSALG